MNFSKNTVAKIEDKILLAYKALDVNQITKIFKNKKTQFVVDTLNQLEDPNAIIFTMIILQKDSKVKLISLDWLWFTERNI